jgi:hypothetical protein
MFLFGDQLLILLVSLKIKPLPESFSVLKVAISLASRAFNAKVFDVYEGSLL